MDQPNLPNYAFIDGQNLNLAVQALGWKVDFRRFRIYLKEKYHVTKAYYFLGYVEGNSDLYQSLQEAGYILVFKPTLESKDGSVKGNCDAELVLQVMVELPNFHQAVIVTGDGDFRCLIDYLIEHGKMDTLLVPNRQRYSALLKKAAGAHIRFISDLKSKLQYTHIKKHSLETGQ